MADEKQKKQSLKENLKQVSFKEFVSCVKGYGVYTVLAPLFILLEVGLEVFIPYMMQYIIDRGITPGDMASIGKYSGIMLALAFGALLAGALSARFAAVATMGFAKNLRKKMFEKVQDFSFHNVDKYSTGSLITRLTTDVNFVQNAFTMLIRIAFRAPVMFISSIVLAVKINPTLSLIFIAIAPVMAVGLALVGGLTFPRFERMFKKFDTMNNRLQENLVGIRVVKAFVREDHETEEFRKVSGDVQKLQVKAEKMLTYAQPVVMLFMYVCMVCVVWFGGKMVLNGTGMTLGSLSSFLSYINQILISLIMVAMILVNLVMSTASAARCSEILGEKPDINDDNADKDLTVADGRIDFENVNFGYNKDGTKNILENINLHIEPGETVGVIGGTGSAKSTLVQLIPRLYDVTGGAVKVGGHDVREYTIHTLRDSVAMVLQKNVLFSGTIKENLMWGNEHATDEEIHECARNAQADDFIRSFPNGYDTYLGQGGVNVSGGQKQRLCIARALLKKPKIMILDDSTSAVDTATDASIRAAFKENLKDTTVIIIAQRIASVMDADKIIVMDEGKIVSEGTHAELMETSPIYREVYESQQKGVE